MTCRHRAGDPSCSSSEEGRERARQEAEQETRARAKRDAEQKNKERARLEAELRMMTPDATQYEIVAAERVGKHLVLKVLYPNCKKCSYEGNKIMVFLNVSEMQVLRWKKIDPHFRSGDSPLTEAPSPAARFPASDDGWADALIYAKNRG